MDKPHIGIVIVTWNNASDIKTCLTSLFEQDYPRFSVVLVDNNSSDNTVPTVQEHFPQVDIIQQKKNYYLCKSNNDGIRYLWDKQDPQYVMVLNPDTKLEPNLLTQLVALAETDEYIAAVGPKVLFWNNEHEGRINSAGMIYDGFMHAYDRGFMEEDAGQYDKTECMKALSGTCILYRSSALKKVGLYFEPLKMYMDDVELGIRLRKQGYKLMYNPKAVIHHAYMASTGKNPKFSVSKQQAWAWLLIALRHYSWKSKLAMVWKYVRFKLRTLN